MLKKYLKTKLHGLIVKEANPDYTGSITIPADILEVSGMKVFEMVQVVNVTNGERFKTYIIEGNSGYVALNGGAAKKGSPGDKLIVFSSVWIETETELPIRVVIMGLDNKVASIDDYTILT